MSRSTTEEGPVAVVTGGSSGIGLAIVRELLAGGYRVAFFSQQEERVAAVRQGLSSEFSDTRVFARAVDLRAADDVRGFFAAVTQHWQAPAALVCNAGFSPKRTDGRAPLAEIDLAEWNDVLAVNLTGALLCCQSVLPAMMQQRFGRIALIGSLAGRTLPRIAGAAYVASKSALVGLARSIVSEYSRFGVTANTICPGRILTEMAGLAEAPANRAALERIPIGRLGNATDIARVAAFVLRPDSDFINGAVIDVNGGEFTPP
jgi:3-oxoacyl-[acyl-carrier protein] reductase